MIATMLLAGALLAPSTAAAAPACDPVPGAEQLWSRPETRFVFIGEMHGTAEAPAAFADLVCLASAARPVTVAIEAPASSQPKLDSFLSSPDTGAARAALLADSFWTNPFKDGRSSLAMLAMLEDVRRLRLAGRDVAVAAFQPDRPPSSSGFDQSYYELEMAQLLSKIAQRRPNSLVLVLVGDIHAGKTPVAQWGGGLPAAAHLSPKNTVSLYVASQGGEAWYCQDRTGEANPKPEAMCRAYPAGAAHDPKLRGVILEPQRDGDYDGLLAVGPTTASPPAVR